MPLCRRDAQTTALGGGDCAGAVRNCRGRRWSRCESVGDVLDVGRVVVVVGSGCGGGDANRCERVAPMTTGFGVTADEDRQSGVAAMATTASRVGVWLVLRQWLRAGGDCGGGGAGWVCLAGESGDC